jgi:toxin ParE1/3/4
MARLEIMPDAVDDLDHILDALVQYKVSNAPHKIQKIRQAINVLSRCPLIGRSAGNGKRELIIGHGKYGYLACYRYIAALDTVFVLSIRSQRQADPPIL